MRHELSALLIANLFLGRYTVTLPQPSDSRIYVAWERRIEREVRDVTRFPQLSQVQRATAFGAGCRQSAPAGARVGLSAMWLAARVQFAQIRARIRALRRGRIWRLRRFISSGVVTIPGSAISRPHTV